MVTQKKPFTILKTFQNEFRNIHRNYNVLLFNRILLFSFTCLFFYFLGCSGKCLHCSHALISNINETLKIMSCSKSLYWPLLNNAYHGIVTQGIASLFLSVKFLSYT